MPALADDMPTIVPSQADLQGWDAIWLGMAGSNGAAKAANCFDKKQVKDFGKVFDLPCDRAVAEMLGGISAVELNPGGNLLPAQPHCVEVAKARIIGGIRPQNFDGECPARC